MVEWPAALGVALGVSLGLILFSILFATAMWTWDRLGKRREAKAQESKLQAEVEELRQLRRSNNQTIQRQRRELTELRGQLKNEKVQTKMKSKPPLLRSSSWDRIIED